jgi:hypothetical protein
VIYALCATFLVVKFSETKLYIVVACIAAHLFFTVRCRGLLSKLSITQFTYRCLWLALLPLYVFVIAANKIERFFEKTRIRMANHTRNMRLPSSVLRRPQQITGEEEEFFTLCEHILSETIQEVRKPGCACKAELQQLIDAITDSGRRLTEMLDQSKVMDVAALTAVLKPYNTMATAESITCYARSLSECITAVTAVHANCGNRNDSAFESMSSMPAKNKSAKLPPAYDVDVEHDGASHAQFRAVRFRTVASSFIWLDKRPGPNSFAQSSETASADYFLSHCWNDPPEAKASLLRSFLFVQTFVAVTLSATIVFALAVIPTGIILSEINSTIVWWAPCVFVLCMGGLVLLWTMVAHFTGAKSQYAPWFVSRISCWLDKCCIDQSSPESKKSGIAHLGDSLEKCKCMIVIFSAQYLERMWCTYELAAYCKLMQNDPEKKLVFLSLSWSAWYSPKHLGKAVELSKEETSALRTYSCKNAKIWKREDRDIVLAKIKEQWETVELFDTFVREELPKVLLRGKVEYYQQFKNVLLQSCTLLFG